MFRRVRLQIRIFNQQEGTPLTYYSFYFVHLVPLTSDITSATSLFLRADLGRSGPALHLGRRRWGEYSESAPIPGLTNLLTMSPPPPPTSGAADRWKAMSPEITAPPQAVSEVSSHVRDLYRSDGLKASSGLNLICQGRLLSAKPLGARTPKTE